jgi:CYTH domain-containing protein
MFDRTPGRGRYAVTEREQRWLLDRLPADVADPVEILDKYLPSSTLRLRRAQSGSAVVYKLGQKVRDNPGHPSINQMTNLYLSESEFQMLGQVDGAALSKTRWHWTVGEDAFSVDQFHGLLRGLVLAEIERAPDGACPPPPLAVAEVTDDDRFSGGRLASLARSEAEILLRIAARLASEKHPQA